MPDDSAMYRLFTYSLLACSLFTAWPLAAQSNIRISGHVLDARDGRPVADAHVQAAGTALGAVTNRQGAYLLEDLPTGLYRLTVTHVGYATQYSDIMQVTADVTTRWDVHLHPLQREGAPVVISASRDNKPAHPTASIVIVTAEDIAHSGAATVGEALRMAPGVMVREQGAGGSQTVTIRGSDSDEVLVMLDDIRLNTSNTSTVDLSRIPASIVERIEVIKGGNSAQYGAGAMAGVVVIRTRSHLSPVEPRASLRTTLGSFGRRDSGANLGFQRGAFTGMGYYDRQDITGNFSYTPPYESETTPRRNNDLLSHNLFGKMVWSGNALTANISGQYTRSRRGLPGFVPNITPLARSRDRMALLSGKMYYRMNSTLSLDTRLNYQQVSDIDTHKPDGNVATVLPPYHTKTTSASTEMEIGLDWHHGDTHQLRGAWQYRRDRMNGRDILRPQYAIGRHTRPWQSGMLHYTQEQSLPWLMEVLVMQASLRYEHSDQMTNRLTPKAGLAFSRGGILNVQIRGNVGQSWRMPDFYDLYFEGYRTRGNPELLPERGTDLDGGLTLSLNRWGRWETGATWFRNRRRDIIQWRQTWDGVFTPVNVPKASIDGGEFSVAWTDPHDALSLGINYLYSATINRTGERTTDGKWLTNRPRHNLQWHARWRTTRWFCELRERILGKRYVTEANTVALPGHAVMDATVGYRCTLPQGLHLTARLTGQNLFNKDMQILEGAPLPGREVRTHFEVSF
jgi:vitamin B12 transporter